MKHPRVSQPKTLRSSLIRRVLSRKRCTSQRCDCFGWDASVRTSARAERSSVASPANTVRWRPRGNYASGCWTHGGLNVITPSPSVDIHRTALQPPHCHPRGHMNDSARVLGNNACASEDVKTVFDTVAKGTMKKQLMTLHAFFPDSPRPDMVSEHYADSPPQSMDSIDSSAGACLLILCTVQS